MGFIKPVHQSDCCLFPFGESCQRARATTKEKLSFDLRQSVGQSKWRSAQSPEVIAAGPSAAVQRRPLWSCGRRRAVKNYIFIIITYHSHRQRTPSHRAVYSWYTVCSVLLLCFLLYCIVPPLTTCGVVGLHVCTFVLFSIVVLSCVNWPNTIRPPDRCLFVRSVRLLLHPPSTFYVPRPTHEEREKTDYYDDDGNWCPEGIINSGIAPLGDETRINYFFSFYVYKVWWRLRKQKGNKILLCPAENTVIRVHISLVYVLLLLQWYMVCFCSLLCTGRLPYPVIVYYTTNVSLHFHMQHMI